jgi:uncharacterized protein YdeI (YjbR/CyaY-like superfamily)
MTEDPQQLEFAERGQWRGWLSANHERARVVWLVFWKKHTGRVGLSYDAAVEEALCFGWIDSLVKRLDDERFLRKFTPRTDSGKWSESNLKRIEKLVASGRMTPAGLAMVDPQARPLPPISSRPTEPPGYFREALARNAAARRTFDTLAPSYRRNYIAWVGSARREATRQRRLAEALALLERGETLGMK